MLKYPRLILRLVVLALVAGILVTGIAPVQAAPRLETASARLPYSLISPAAITTPLGYKGSGVHFFDISTIPLKLTNIQYYVIDGVLVDGQYQFPIQMKFDPNVRVGGIEIAENRQAHTELIEVGIPTGASAALDTLRSGPVSQVQPNTSGSGSAPLHLIWHDPINIWVVEVFDILHWNYNGSTTTITSNTSSTYDYDHWLSADGWSRVSHYASDGYSLGGYQAWDSTQAAFTNPIFCSASGLGNGATSIGVTYNEADGYADGTRGASIRTSVSGGCTSLLNYFWQWG